ncbi:sulfotransferase [Chromohalobacter japonicus]|uniref:sulfotransferase n=1 Tax=Chromohalobacter japonicus TaxID=223900 RepID=UPI001FF4B622|nr:sulfotransferase [Chromohalobacter japonicus]MCK0753254.1 sulfotransferase [Chromohalobacter japonicus]
MSVTPVVICGMGRSGTRNVADNIAKHPLVQIYGEIPPNIMDSFLEFFFRTNSAFLKSPFGKGWADRKNEFFFDCLNNISKEKIEFKKDGRKYVGYKSPNHERFFNKIEQCFSGEEVKPCYIYCIRDALSCWQSYKSMEWNKLDVEGFIEQYVESVNFYFSMLDKFEKRVVLFNLNEYKTCNDKEAYFKYSILRNIGMSEPDLVHFKLDEKNRNATKKFIGKDSEGLPVKEESMIAGNDKIKEINQFFGF